MVNTKNRLNTLTKKNKIICDFLGVFCHPYETCVFRFHEMCRQYFSVCDGMCLETYPMDL